MKSLFSSSSAVLEHLLEERCAGLEAEDLRIEDARLGVHEYQKVHQSRPGLFGEFLKRAESFTLKRGS